MRFQRFLTCCTIRLGLFAVAGFLATTQVSEARAAAPTAPTGLTATAVSGTVISLSWADNSTTETAFRIERSLTGTSNFALVAKTGANATSYQNTGLKSATKYYYRVCALRNTTKSAWTNVASATTTMTDSTPPSVPSGVSASAPSCSQVDIRWNASTDTGSGLAGYRVSRDGIVIASTPATSFSNTGLPGSVSHSYAVAAYDNAGNVSAPSGSVTGSTPACTQPNQPPAANAGADRSALTLVAVTFDGTGSSDSDGSIASYAWSFGDGGTAAGASVSHSFATSGVYTVTLTVTDNGGLTSSDTASVTITNRPPTANAGPDQTMATGSSLGFNGSGSSDMDGNVATYSWSFGDGATGSGMTASHSYATAGSYTVNLTVTDNKGATASDTASVTITNRPPAANAGADQTTTAGTAITLSGSGSSDQDGSISSYAWTFGDGGTASGMAVSHAFATAGTYTVSLTVTDNLGAAGSDTAVVTVSAAAPTIPNAPTNLTAVAVSSSQINLSWTDNSSNETGFRIERSASSVGPWSAVATTTISSYSDTGIAPALTCYYRISAFNTAGSSTVTNTASATTLTATPAAPSALFAAATSSSQITLSWVDNSSNETGFKVERATSATGPWAQFAVAGANATGLSDSNLSASTSFWYRTCATNSAGDSAYSNVASATTQASSVVPGAYRWSSGTMGSSMALTEGIGIATDPSTGSAVVVGDFYDIVDFGGISLSTLTTEAFISKYASTGARQWTIKAGGPATDVARGVAVNGRGEIIVTGNFAGTADFGGVSLTSLGSDDVFVAAYSGTQTDGSRGTALWARRIGSSSASALDRGLKVAIDNVSTDGDGVDNIVVTGFMQGTVNFGFPAFNGTCGTIGGAGIFDVFVAKLSADGSTCLWARALGGSGVDTPSGLAIDGSGNVIVSGSFQNTMSLGSQTLTSKGSDDIFLVKLSPSGAPLWGKSFGDTNAATSDKSTGVAVSGSGNLVLTGWLNGMLDFGGGVTLTNGAGSPGDIFLAGFDANGAALWGRQYGTNLSGSGQNEYSSGIAVDAAGNIALTGNIFNGINFGCGGLVGNGSRDTFLAKFSSDGSCAWSKRVGGLGEDDGNAVAFDGSGNVLGTGSFRGAVGGPVDFGGGALPGRGSYDAYITKYGQ